MLLTIERALDDATLANIQARLDAGRYADGTATAGADAARVKRNEELERSAAGELDALALGPLLRNPTFQAAVQPLRMTAATFARYRPGMAYGRHTDDPIMGPPESPMRCDVAVTVFLSEPSSYEGGELVIHLPDGTRSVKLRRGAVVAYPASTLHEVAEVRTGERRVAVAWAQSRVRSTEQRDLLYDLWCARDSLRAGLPQAAVTSEVDRIYTALTRMWSEV